jgi:hypothetical protein
MFFALLANEIIKPPFKKYDVSDINIYWKMLNSATGALIKQIIMKKIS